MDFALSLSLGARFCRTAVLSALALSAAFSISLIEVSRAEAGQMAWASAFGRVYRNNGGTSFVPPAASVSARLQAVDFINAQTGWSVGESAGAPSPGANSGNTLMKSTNGGVSWTIQNDGVNGFDGTSGYDAYYDVDFLNNLDGYVVGAAGIILSSHNGGTSWTRQTSLVSATLNDVQMTSLTNAYVTGDNGVVLKTTNSGTTWSPISVPANLDLRGVQFVDPNNGWVVGGNWGNGKAVIARTTNGGASWSQQIITQTSFLYDVHFVNNQTGFAVGANGVVMKTVNAGVNWNPISVSATVNLYGVDFRSPLEGYIVGGNEFAANGAAVIRHTIDGGTTWTTEGYQNFNNLFTDVSMVSSNSGTVQTGSNVAQSFGGGATVANGTSFSFPTVTAIGTLSSDAVPIVQLSEQAQTDFANTGYPLLGTQAWQVTWDGQFTGNVTLQFGVSPSLLAGIDPAQIKVLKRDTTTGQIIVLPATVIGGNIIQVQTPGFSDFVISVPEPSTLVLAAAGVLMLGAIRFRRRKTAD